MTIQPFQQRVIDERGELEEKIHKLSVFVTGEIFPLLPKDEQERLTVQLSVMALYVTILQHRIENFERVPEPQGSGVRVPTVPGQ